METEILISPETVRRRKVIADVLSQAISGELVGMSNFAALAGIMADIHEKMEAVEHAESERQHALGFQRIAIAYDLPVIANIEGIYWKTLRDKFLNYAQKGDFIACLIIQASDAGIFCRIHVQRCRSSADILSSVSVALSSGRRINTMSSA